MPPRSKKPELVEDDCVARLVNSRLNQLLKQLQAEKDPVELTDAEAQQVYESVSANIGGVLVSAVDAAVAVAIQNMAFGLGEAEDEDDDDEDEDEDSDEGEPVGTGRRFERD